MRKNFYTRLSFKGITIIELLLIISIVVIMSASAYPFGASFLARNAVKNKTNEIVTSLRIAQINAISGKNDSSWGVYIDASTITMYMGSSYTSPGTAHDHIYSIPSNVSITPAEINFSTPLGEPSTTASISVSGSGISNTISINELGIVDVN